MKYQSIAALHEAYRSGATTVAAVIEESLAAFEATKGLNAAISLLAESARERAAILDEELKGMRETGAPLPALFGVPLGVKDMLQLEGSKTTAASLVMADYESQYTATAVARAMEAGAIPVAKLNCDEFAMGSSNENSAFGPVKNPHGTDRVPGGSSGGSAASVAAGQCLVSLGTDTGGSIRQPAALCGVVGIKPTYGRVSRYGAFALASSLDQIGPFGATVADAAALLQSIAGADANDLTSSQIPVGDYVAAANAPRSLNGARVGVPREWFAEGMDEAVKERVQAVIERMRAEGATVVDVSLPHSKYALATYYLIQPAECSSNLARYDGMRYGHRREADDSVEGATPFDRALKATRAEFGPEVRRRLMLGAYVLSHGYYEEYYHLALKVRRVIADDFLKAFRSCDVLVGPTSPTVAWKIGMKVDDPLTMYLSDVYTVPINLAGLPGASVPIGFADNEGESLPVGLQIVAPHWQEESMISYAAAIERLTR